MSRKTYGRGFLHQTPASQKIYLEALGAGYETPVEAGCGYKRHLRACYGGHMGCWARRRCLSTTRNFKARMGDAESEVLLCSPATAAASALTGKITDPRKFLGA